MNTSLKVPSVDQVNKRQIIGNEDGKRGGQKKETSAKKNT